MLILTKFLALWAAVTAGSLIGPAVRGEVSIWVLVVLSFVVATAAGVGEHLGRKKAITEFIKKEK